MPLNATGITGELDKRRSFKHGDCPRQGLKGKDVDRDGYCCYVLDDLLGDLQCFNTKFRLYLKKQCLHLLGLKALVEFSILNLSFGLGPHPSMHFQCQLSNMYKTPICTNLVSFVANIPWD